MSKLFISHRLSSQGAASFSCRLICRRTLPGRFRASSLLYFRLKVITLLLKGYLYHFNCDPFLYRSGEKKAFFDDLLVAAYIEIIDSIASTFVFVAESRTPVPVMRQLGSSFGIV